MHCTVLFVKNQVCKSVKFKVKMEEQNQIYEKCCDNCTCTAKSIVNHEVDPKQYITKTKQGQSKKFSYPQVPVLCVYFVFILC